MLWYEDLHSGRHLPTIIDLARKATALRPDVAKNWCMLASFLIQAGDEEQAIAVLTEAISKLPPDSRLYEMLARTSRLAPRVELLREALQRAPAIPIDGRETIISRFEPLMKSWMADDEAQVATDTLGD